MAKRARLCNLVPISTAKLELPADEDLQTKIEFPAPDEIPEPTDETEN
jgi:hypothetical protein